MVERPRHILRGDRSAVHWLHVLPFRVGSQREGPGLAVLAWLPGFGQVALHDVRLTGHPGALLRHQQATVVEGRKLLNAVAHVQVWIQARWVAGPEAELEAPAVLRCCGCLGS